jgi:hypothetical protein
MNGIMPAGGFKLERSITYLTGSFSNPPQGKRLKVVEI